MKTMKSLMVGLLLAVPFSLSAESGESFLVIELRDHSSGRSARTLVHKDSTGVTTRVKAERIEVENNAIRCVGEVTITRENVTIRANEIVFDTRQAPVFLLNPEGVKVSDVVPKEDTSASPKAGTNAPLEFRGRFPATNTGLAR
jgi:hypothetical protein